MVEGNQTALESILSETSDRSDGVALVVDDDKSSRLLLKSALLSIGYQVIEAEDGQQGVDLFKRHEVDIVFMDISMPVMDGLEATRLIKESLGIRFVPVIFVTASSGDEALARCIIAGGDDFLTKPYSSSTVRSKTIAASRTQALYRRITHLEQQRKQEETLAKDVIYQGISADNVPLLGLKTLIHPASSLSGDLLLTGFRPDGDLYLFLGNFNKTGLLPSIASLPIADIFRAMTRKGFSAAEVLQQINDKLQHIGPTRLLLSGCFVWLQSAKKQISVWNGAMSDTRLISRRTRSIKQHFRSSLPPLGTTRLAAGDFMFESAGVDNSDQLILTSDGIYELTDYRGDKLGAKRFEQAVLDGLLTEDAFDHVKLCLERFCAENQILNDISLVSMPCLLPSNSVSGSKRNL